MLLGGLYFSGESHTDPNLPVFEADLLMKRLENKVFRAMQTANSPLYEPGLAAVLVKKEGSAKAKAKARYDVSGSITNLPSK